MAGFFSSHLPICLIDSVHAFRRDFSLGISEDGRTDKPVNRTERLEFQPSLFYRALLLSVGKDVRIQK